MLLARDVQRHLNAIHPDGYQLKTVCLPTRPMVRAPIPLAQLAEKAVISLHAVNLTAFSPRHPSNDDESQEAATRKQRTLAGQVVEEDEEDLDLPDIPGGNQHIPQPPARVEIDVSRKRAYSLHSNLQPP